MVAGMSTTDAGRPGTRVRKRNKRGEGFRLREEIIAAAGVILERTESEDAVTLRAVAREIGIAAPSIAAHFADRAEIIDTVIAKELSVLSDRMTAAAASVVAPVDRLFAICRAYVAYGRTHPGRYRALVGRRFLDDWEAQDRIMEASAPLMAATIQLVVGTIQDCIDTGAATGTDAFADTAVLWFALHGLITVPQAITSIPWPDTDDLLTACITGCAHLDVDARPQV
jgi:AcrR family transcriptional regulator